jgi:hypothetical protein
VLKTSAGFRAEKVVAVEYDPALITLAKLNEIANNTSTPLYPEATSG